MCQRLTFYLFIVLGFTASLCPCVAALDADKVVVSEVHIIRWQRICQLEELVRQLQLSALVDVGRDWKDGPNDGINVDGPPWPAFSFRKGSLKELLDAFCKDRPFQWHVWKEANALWLEPKREMHRAAAFYLGRPFKKPLDAVVKERVDDLGWMHMHVNGPGEQLMADCRSLPQEEGLDFFLEAYKQQFFRNSGQARTYVWLPPGNPMPNMLAVLRFWLSSGHSRTVAVQVAERQPNQGEAGPRPRVYLYFGSTDVAVAHMYLSELVEALLADLANQAERINRYEDAIRELYRRYMMQPQEVLRALKELKALERTVEKATYAPDLPFHMLGWDEPVFGKFIIDAFNEASPELKLKMLSFGVIPDPVESGEKYLGFWETLSRSAVPELKKAGIDWVQAYKEAMADKAKEGAKPER